MLDIRRLREDPEGIRRALQSKGEDPPMDRILELDGQRRARLTEAESLKAERNRVSEEIGRRKRAGEDAGPLLERMATVAARIKGLDEELRTVEGQLQDLLLRLPNVPHAAVPPGAGEEDNVEVRRWGEAPRFPFPPRPHWELGPALGILDFERAAKVAGARFVFRKGAGARLERALINFMIDLHVQEHGYTEVYPPFLANGDSLRGTGQLPRLADDMFRCEGRDLYLIPTAEVPVTNLHRGEVLPAEALPLRYVAYSACFRSEAGAHGRDTRGLVRLHEFSKVELVKVVRPEGSYDELEGLLADAEAVLQRLGLPYRVVECCTAELGFTAARKYDPEVWMPSYGRFVEISSCSNFEDFQARRADIRYRPGPGRRPEYVHTLNGSGLAVGRTMAAILENFQEADGSVRIPEALRPYMGGLERIEPPPG